jgi:Family of unknown function (DUF6152)
MWKGRWLSAAGILLVLAAVPLRAHHSFSGEYDTSAPIDLRGTVTRIEWTNPHTFIYLDVAGPDGTHETWQVEAGSPATLNKAKVSRDMLAVGSVVEISGWRHKNGRTRAAGNEIMFANGAKHRLEVRCGQPEPDQLTFNGWLRYSLPSLIRNWLPYVVLGVPIAVLIVGLLVLRSQGKKARV